MVSGGRKRAQDRGPRAGGTAALASSGAHPTGRSVVWHSSFSHPKSRLDELVRGHALNQQVEVVLPGANGRDTSEALQWETSFYYELRASVALLLSPAFLRDYVTQGTVCMIAKNVPVDSLGSAMLLPTGELLLLVDGETYEQLGLLGVKYGSSSPIKNRRSHETRLGQRYLVSIDLKASAFTADPVGDAVPLRERVASILRSKLAPIDMLVCAVNDRGVTRTVLFGDDDTIERTRKEVNGGLTQMRDVFVPRFDAAFAQLRAADEQAKDANRSFDNEELRSTLADAHDWLGLVACRLTPQLQRQLPDEYVSRFSGVPETVECDAEGSVATVRWRGLVAAEFCSTIIDKVRLEVKTKRLPWAAVMVWGFPDALVSWRHEERGKNDKQQQAKAKVANCEHGYVENGSNNYTLLVLPDDEYCLLQTLGPHDAAA